MALAAETISEAEWLDVFSAFAGADWPCRVLLHGRRHRRWVVPRMGQVGWRRSATRNRVELCVPGRLLL